MASFCQHVVIISLVVSESQLESVFAVFGGSVDGKTLLERRVARLWLQCWRLAVRIVNHLRGKVLARLKSGSRHDRLR